MNQVKDMLLCKHCLQRRSEHNTDGSCKRTNKKLSAYERHFKAQSVQTFEALTFQTVRA